MNKVILVILVILFVVYIYLNKKLSKQNYTRQSYFELPGYSDLINTTKFNYTPGGIPKIIIKTSYHK